MSKSDPASSTSPSDSLALEATSEGLVRRRALKHGDTFAVLDERGDCVAVPGGSCGLYHADTRYLSHQVLRTGGSRPLLLGSTISDDNRQLAVDLACPSLDDGLQLVRKDSIHVRRTRLLWNATCYDRLHLANHGQQAARFYLAIELACDFADLFEVRGARRESRGRLLAPRIDGGVLLLSYMGLDEQARTTRVSFDPSPSQLRPSGASFWIELPPGDERLLEVAVECRDADSLKRPIVAVGFGEADQRSKVELAERRRRACHVETSNPSFNAWIDRALADCYTMISDTPHGPYPYAGVPWYNTVFGRDGIITALEMLWVDPEPARGVLRCLAATQARVAAPEREAKPGKIVHELRRGEMAELGEVPFGRYYGTVDATPLYLVLAGEYHARTGDLTTIEELWPSLLAAATWIIGTGDSFLTYSWTPGHAGLTHQGWKDSHDSVRHADGCEPRPPIALCEVQGYVYAAFDAMARLALARGDLEQSTELAERALRLRDRFEQEFWSPELDCYALAIDSDRRPCRVLASNAGHCLYSGIAGADRASRVAKQLLSESMYSGWGIRTLARGEAAYNPMSYHNGSVWPHDNALIAAGLARYGFKREAARILTSMFELGRWLEAGRMPELICGFERRDGQGPVLYPVACSPQAWAAAAPILMLQACLGLEVDGVRSELRFTSPYLPDWLDWIELRGLALPGATVDLLLRRVRHDFGVEVLAKTGPARVVVQKTF